MDEMVQDVQVSSPVAEEKMLPQSQVNEIVKREKAQVAERVRREMEAQMAQGSQPQSMGGMSQAPDIEALKQQMWDHVKQEAQKMDELEAKKAKEAQEAQEREAIQKTADDFWLRLGAGKDKYSDFEEVMQDFEPHAFPQVAFLSAETGSDGQPLDTAGIMYELAKNPTKLTHLNDLAIRSPKMARKEMERLSQSIAKNQKAMQENVNPREPLSQLKSSSSVGADTGTMTLRDYKNADWLRG
ncbi:MAG: hypothetical protein V4568_18075 [Pseudomonadota bacterium]